MLFTKLKGLYWENVARSIDGKVQSRLRATFSEYGPTMFGK